MKEVKSFKFNYMMIKLVTFLIIGIIFSVGCGSPSSQVQEKQLPKQEKYNTVIVQIFDKNISDAKQWSDITFMDNYGLSRYKKIPLSITDIDSTKKIIRVNIKDYEIFNHNGMMPDFLLKPGDSLVYHISYFYKNKYDWGINYDFENKVNPKLESIIEDTLNRSQINKFSLYFPHNNNLLNRNNYKTTIDNIFTKQNLLSTAITTAQAYFKKHPDSARTEKTKQFITDYYTSEILVSPIISVLNKDSVKYYITRSLLNLIQEIDKTIQYKTFHYWWVIHSLYSEINNNANNIPFDISAFEKNLSSETQQYWQTLDIEKRIKNGADTSTIDYSSITIPEFVDYINNLKQKANNGLLPDDVATIEVYNYDYKTIDLKTLFHNTSTKFLMFDMCGSWCKPCMENIQTYSLNKPFDTSAIITPYWMFCENDTLSWKKVIEKYHLKKENCFLIKSENAINILTKTYMWEREFPHYFIFKKSGQLVSGKAPDFSDTSAIYKVLPQI
jgi:hypothetical protein